jgi:shikimate kinase
MVQTSRILFILGPSGVGKSRFGKYLEQKYRWLHLEIDQYRGIDIHELRKEWDLFYHQKNSTCLVDNLHQKVIDTSSTNCVLTFPSKLVLSPEHIKVCESAIQICYLYGSADHCISAFLRRESETKRNLDFRHWINNGGIYLEMSNPSFEPYRVHVFTHDGRKRSNKEIWADVSRANIRV